MASITIRNLDESVKKRLRLRAAEHGKSMEEEARDILSEGVSKAKPLPGSNLFDSIHRRFEPLGGMELEIPKRGPMRKLPDFK